MNPNNTIQLFNEECIQKIKTLQDNTLDCVITDPPYFLDKLDASWDAESVNNDSKNSHIKHLPKGMKFSKQQTKDFYQFYLEASSVMLQKLKPGGFFLSFSSPRLYHAMAMAMDDAGFEIRDQINWVYTQTMPKGMSVNRQIDALDTTSEEKDRLKQKFKDWKTPQLKSCFEPICVAMKPFNDTFFKNELKFGTGLVNFGEKVGIDKVPANIITTESFLPEYDNNFLVKKPSKAEKKDYNNHLSVKPINLMTHLLKLFTKENALVLDPFLGSGTTMVACKLLKRRGIGIEMNKSYFDIAQRRLNETNLPAETENEG